MWRLSFKILQGLAATLNIKDDEFCQRLVDWGDIIRKTFYDGGIEEIISTRRLVHIIRAYAIFKNKAKAIEVCVNRFDDETKQAFMELYDKVDADVEFTPVDDTPQSWYNEGSKTPLMINAYSLAAETLEGTLDETYPVINKISEMKLRPKMRLSDKNIEWLVVKIFQLSINLYYSNKVTLWEQSL